MSDIRVLVLYGGESPEREVSLVSGKAVVGAAINCGFKVIDGQVCTMRDVISLVHKDDFDVVFIALHGGWGEDGRLQAFLEFYGVPYTGSKSEACMLAMNKALSKYKFRHNGIPVPDGIEVDICQGFDVAYQKIKEFYDAIGNEKMIIKPSGCGSTIGVSTITKTDDVLPAMRLAFKYDNLILVERYVFGKELAVTVWDDDKPKAFPIIEIIPKNSIYSYKAKYVPGGSEYIVPASLDQSVALNVQDVAIKAHISLGCRQYSRVDIRLDLHGNPYVLEVNTAPGLTATSLVPKAAKAIGWSFEDLVFKLITTAFNR